MPSVNPKVLVWARETAGLDLPNAAKALNISSAEKLAAYESGDAGPSRALLLRMSQRYHRSLLSFYLAEPPRKGDRGSDFRTLPPDQAVADEATLDVLIRDLRARQALVRDTLLEDEEQSKLAFVGSMSQQNGVDAVAANVRSTLGFDLQRFRSTGTSEKAFAYLRACAEGAGIFVLLTSNLGSHHTTIPVESFRGYAIADEIAPFVVINDQDAKTAWSFTLLHEVAHIWLGTTGVSSARGEMALEQFCNDVASEILLPASEAKQLRLDPKLRDEALIEWISSIADERRVSRQLVAYKLFRSDLMTRQVWVKVDSQLRRLFVEERARRKGAKRSESSGPDYYVVRRHRLGQALLSFADRHIRAGTLTPVKAARVLGVKPRNVYPLLIGAEGQG